MKEKEKVWVNDGGIPKRFGNMSEEVVLGCIRLAVQAKWRQIIQFKVNLHF